MYGSFPYAAGAYAEGAAPIAQVGPGGHGFITDRAAQGGFITDRTDATGFVSDRPANDGFITDRSSG